MASNVKEQLAENINGSKYYSIQLDESTDVSNVVHLLTRFEGVEAVKEELLLCEPLLGHTTTSNGIFKNIRPVHEGSWHRMEKKMCWTSLRWSTCSDRRTQWRCCPN
jgi:hypothetical protein